MWCASEWAAFIGSAQSKKNATGDIPLSILRFLSIVRIQGAFYDAAIKKIRLKNLFIREVQDK